MGSFSFPKLLRLLNRSAFVNLNRSGERHYTRHFTVILKQNGLGIARLGVAVGRRTGNAVKRNRVKRLIREFFRLNRQDLPPGHDIVIVAKKDASYMDLEKVTKELGKVLFNERFRVEA